MASTAIHDETYYFEDGSCVLKVEGYLFNLHRSTLRRHSGFFRDMFAIPQEALIRNGRSTFEGESDENPILCNDNVEAFRSWCWVLYAGFNELEVAKEGHHFTDKTYTHIASLSHKYACDSIEKWARELLDAKLDQAVGQTQNTIKKSTLEYIVGTSMQCGWVQTQKSSEKLLLRYTGGTPASLSRMLRFAESVCSPQLKARAFYAFLGAIGWNVCPAPTGRISLDLTREDTTVQVWWDPWEAFTDGEKITLYRGFLGLSRLRDQLRLMPKLNGGDNSCQCIRYDSLRSRWDRHALESSHIKDPKEFLIEVESRLKTDSNPRLRCSSQNCATVRLCQDLKHFIESFDGRLMIFFPA
ncbi:hypothetical protein NP233_g3410 [Leucocoprinus birnbaumii]|uniref:BTB domain-containing protein n=1 Tax=Leucocoprinus birnbaumii TaxID=56174 RepID=A0AAD5VX86_9AGAR|nr:hypothetical protein NP233_g3410 [Leucocoprinus birnbaumii]